MGWRDKYQILLYGTYAAMPPSGDEDQWYRVTSGDTNVGKLYKGTGSSWAEVPGDPYVAPHALDGDSHTGYLPLSRVTGHDFYAQGHKKLAALGQLNEPF